MSIEGIDYRMVAQRRRFKIGTRSQSGGWNEAWYETLADTRKAYHAALVAIDAGLLKEVLVRSRWLAYNEDGMDVHAEHLMKED